LTQGAAGAGLKICVFGAGAIGGHLAARLSRGGAEVSVVARGAHLAAIQARGLRIEAPDGIFTAVVHATDDPASLGPQDAVLVTVKSPSLGSVAATIAPLLGADTPVVFVINGIPWWYFDKHGGALDGTRLELLDPGGAVRAAIGPGRAIGGVVYSACTVMAPGVVHVEHQRNRLVLGELDGHMSARAAAIAAPLTAGGFTMEVSPDIRSVVWSKLMLNLAAGPICVLTTQPGRLNLQEAAVEAAMRAIYAESEAVARALGCNPLFNAESSIAGSRKTSHKPSILQDLELGRPMEVATMFDAPLALARLAGVATPTLDLLVALARLRAQAAGLFA
jgi:2-dehydropantoate 2-reductase